MSNAGFTTEEHSGFVRGSIPLLWRYVRSLPLLRKLALPSIMSALLGTAGYQLFVWLSGEFARCGGTLSCQVPLRWIDVRLPLSIAVLAMIAIGVVTIRVLGWIFFEVGGQWAALVLHRRMVAGVARVRTTFFDEYPSGKLINRLVRDFDALRVMGPVRIGDTMNALIELLMITIVISLASPLAALAVFPTLAVFLYIQRNVAPMLQRCLTLRSVRLGEVLHRETDVIEGIRSFLLYRHERALFARLKAAVDGFVQMHLLRLEIEAWGRFWAQFASALYGFIALVFVAYGVQSGTLSAVLGALVITAVFRLGGTFGWLTWASGLLFESAAHARRVFEYVDLPEEEHEEGTPQPISGGDPAIALAFVRYSMRYRRTTPLILQDLTLQVAKGTKLGIIGRTGAGKTSMLQSLFRMVYVEGGDIQVFGQSLFAQSAEASRQLFGVVPQDPYLFEGTVRSNLDRYRQHSDASLRDALATVQLTLALEHPIQEGGRNLSLGQRQLLCLARVLLSSRPIIVMDEPTSGVDTITDAVIQRVLRTALADRTVITIAHRLETLARVDRIVELRDGRVVQDGTPQELIPNLSVEALA